MGNALRFVWFWTFWHWSKESFRAEMLLRGPLNGIAGNWDEWFHHEACAEEQTAIAEVGGSERAQRDFVQWLLHTWAAEALPGGNKEAPVFALHELARVAPFDRWSALLEYRTPPKSAGIYAIVLAEESAGQSTDLRRVDAVVLPVEPSEARGMIVADDFQAEMADLNASRQAVIGVLNGSGLTRLLSYWAALGPRAYSRWLAALLTIGWCSVSALLAYLLFGPEPGGLLPTLSATLLALWLALLFVSAVGLGTQIRAAWQAGKRLTAHLQQDEIRMTMPGQLALKGGSAGFAFSLSALAAIHRAYPHVAERSWLWQRFFSRLNSSNHSRAATGMITCDGHVRPVLIEPKLRACAEQDEVGEIFAPKQRDATQRKFDQILSTLRPAESTLNRTHSGTATSPGYAAESRRPQIRRCRHLADAVAKIGALSSPWQAAMNTAALALSGVMFAALPDLRCILLPPPPPAAVAPSSPSPYFLWVSLDTKRPDFFQVVLESQAWVNRRADVAPRNSTPASVRAEIRLVRATAFNDKPNFEEGTVWIERRPRLLLREYAPTERVGRYSLRYLLRLGYE